MGKVTSEVKTVFKTTDGKTFDVETDAEKHQGRVDIDNILDKMDVYWREPDTADLVTGIIDHIDDIVEAVARVKQAHIS